MENYFDTTQFAELLLLVKNIGVGLLGLFCLIWINMFFIRRISLNFEINARVHLGKHQYNRVFVDYLLAAAYFMLVQIAAIVFWGVILSLLKLIDSMQEAVLFAGSCYTTIGIVSNIMPTGWKIQAVFIALSGLFAIALTTAAMLSMNTLFRHAWMCRHADYIRKVIRRKGIETPGFINLIDADLPSHLPPPKH